MFGSAQEEIPVISMDIIPVEKRQLHSKALGWSGGGDIPVIEENEQSATTAEPFFEVRSKLGATVSAHLLHGRSGKIRFDLEPEPFLPRWMRRLSQVLQRRYQL